MRMPWAPPGGLIKNPFARSGFSHLRFPDLLAPARSHGPHSEGPTSDRCTWLRPGRKGARWHCLRRGVSDVARRCFWAVFTPLLLAPPELEPSAVVDEVVGGGISPTLDEGFTKGGSFCSRVVGGGQCITPGGGPLTFFTCCNIFQSILTIPSRS